MNKKLIKKFGIKENSIEFQKIKEAIKGINVKLLSRRYYAIYYYLKCYSNKEIAKLLDLNEHTIETYIKKV